MIIIVIIHQQDQKNHFNDEAFISSLVRSLFDSSSGAWLPACGSYVLFGAMFRIFDYYHDGEDTSLLIAIPFVKTNSVCFMSGPDYGYSLTPLHGEFSSYVNDEGRFLEVKFCYEWPSDFMHHCVFRERVAEQGVYVETTGYPVVIVERLSRQTPWTPLCTSRPSPTAAKLTVRRTRRPPWSAGSASTLVVPVAAPQAAPAVAAPARAADRRPDAQQEAPTLVAPMAAPQAALVLRGMTQAALAPVATRRAVAAQARAAAREPRTQWGQMLVLRGNRNALPLCPLCLGSMQLYDDPELGTFLWCEDYPTCRGSLPDW